MPFGGAKWYLLTALSPLAGVYYWQRGTRQEEIQACMPDAHRWCHLHPPRFCYRPPACMEQVKMVTSDDETVTDITVRVAVAIAAVHVVAGAVSCCRRAGAGRRRGTGAPAAGAGPEGKGQGACQGAAGELACIRLCSLLCRPFTGMPHGHASARSRSKKQGVIQEVVHLVL